LQKTQKVAPFSPAADEGVRLKNMKIDRDELDKLSQLFNLEKKSEVVKYCKTLEITSEALFAFILAGKRNTLAAYLYEEHFYEFIPEQLNLSNSEINSLAKSKKGNLEGIALKASKKISQSFTDRKLLSVHLFYTAEKNAWHIFYFDQRDTCLFDNHWGSGPHIHYVNDTLNNKPLDEIWNEICSTKPKFPKSIHIRYDYHHNRK